MVGHLDNSSHSADWVKGDYSKGLGVDEARSLKLPMTSRVTASIQGKLAAIESGGPAYQHIDLAEQFSPNASIKNISQEFRDLGLNTWISAAPAEPSNRLKEAIAQGIDEKSQVIDLSLPEKVNSKDLKKASKLVQKLSNKPESASAEKGLKELMKKYEITPQDLANALKNIKDADEAAIDKALSANPRFADVLEIDVNDRGNKKVKEIADQLLERLGDAEQEKSGIDKLAKAMSRNGVTPAKLDALLDKMGMPVEDREKVISKSSELEKGFEAYQAKSASNTKKMLIGAAVVSSVAAGVLGAGLIAGGVVLSVFVPAALPAGVVMAAGGVVLLGAAVLTPALTLLAKAESAYVRRAEARKQAKVEAAEAEAVKMHSVSPLGIHRLNQSPRVSSENIVVQEAIQEDVETVDTKALTTIEKADDVAQRKFGEIKHVAQGKAKKVFADDRHAYYIPMGIPGTKTHTSKLNEIMREKETADRINYLLEQKGVKAADVHIATDLEELTGDDRVEGQYTLRTIKADGDLEAGIRKDLTMGQRLELCKQAVTSMAALHIIDMVHGDTKPDNFLYYNDNTLMLADFGKTEEMRNGQMKMHTGNPRFAAPEGVLSKKAEVWSMGMILVRILEEAVLREEGMLGDAVKKGSVDELEAQFTENMGADFVDESTGLIRGTAPKPNQEAPEMVYTNQFVNLSRVDAKKQRRGIERFVVANDKMIQGESSLPIENIRVRSKMVFKFIQSNIPGVRNSLVNPAGKSEVGKYVDELFKKIEQYGLTENRESLNDLKDVVMDMLNEEPNDRINMAEAKLRLDDINL